MLQPVVTALICILTAYGKAFQHPIPRSFAETYITAGTDVWLCTHSRRSKTTGSAERAARPHLRGRIAREISRGGAVPGGKAGLQSDC